jgi:hypothetical protein
MDENTNPEQQEQQGPQEQQNPATTPTKTTKKTEIRTISELHNVAVGKMSDKEIAAYVKYMREFTNTLQQQVGMFQENAQSAFKKAQYFESQYNKLRLEAETKLNFAKNAVEHCRTSIMLTAKLEA